MAVETLYNASRDVLLERVRMKTADDSQTIALIDQTITEVRIGFYRTLTTARATLIAGYTLVDNPMTEEEVLRSGAANTEALWVTWLLAQRLPHLFLDNKASTGDMWNEEQLTRDTQDKKFLANLKTQIDIGLGDLMEPISGNSGPVKVSAIKNDTPLDAFNPNRGLYPKGMNVGSF
jgi:hypothetical protein